MFKSRTGAKKEQTPRVCKISGKIEFSHHENRGGFLICRKQIKAPHNGGASNYLDAFRRIPEMKSLSFPSKRMSNILIIFSL